MLTVGPRVYIDLQLQILKNCSCTTAVAVLAFLVNFRISLPTTVGNLVGF